MDNNIDLKQVADSIVTSGLTDKIMNQVHQEPEQLQEVQSPTTIIVDSAPVIVAPPKFDMGAANDLMKTPVPVPVSTGLELGTLDTPQNPITSAVSPEQRMILLQINSSLNVDDPVNGDTVKYYLSKYSEYMQSMITQHGMNPEAAKITAIERLKREGYPALDTATPSETKEEEVQEEQTDKPSIGIITIDKTDTPAEALALTDEEHKKLEKVKRIRLVTITDTDLANIKIERPPEEHKADYVRSIDGSVSNYQIPLPTMGDFISLKGAQIVQMVNVVNYDDARIEEIINKKASLIYDKLIGGTVTKKYDETGKIVMSYTEFINKFPYQDIDIALYGILCASNMEEGSVSLTCENCKHNWDQKYNLKRILKFDTISDTYKERIDTCLKNKSNDVVMRKLFEEMRQVRRYKSPFSGNIYDVSYPTVARATNILKRIDQNDQVMTYTSASALYLSRVLIYNHNSDSYVEITAEETDLMLDTLMSISNDDMTMLTNQIKDDLIYKPTFAIDAQCPSCERKTPLPIGIENLVFLRAQDTMVEIAT